MRTEWLERAERQVPPEAMLGLKDNLLVDDIKETQKVKEILRNPYYNLYPAISYE